LQQRRRADVKFQNFKGDMSVESQWVDSHPTGPPSMLAIQTPLPIRLRAMATLRVGPALAVPEISAIVPRRILWEWMVMPTPAETWAAPVAGINQLIDQLS
jgi:hypothetical protein